MRLARSLHALRERMRTAWHFWFGPTRRQVEEAKRVLAGRQYYQLYDDLWRELRQTGGSAELEARDAAIRELIHGDFEELLRRGRIPGRGTRLIDLGCGEGENAIYFARLGYQVTGVDASPTAIDTASRLAGEQGVTVTFGVADVLGLAGIEEAAFDIATDIGLLHMLVRDEHRRWYLESVRRVLRPGGAFFLFNRVSRRDVKVRDEDALILRYVTLVRHRWRTPAGAWVQERGIGFRNASVRQYRHELAAAGFEPLLSQPHDDYGMVMLLARAP
jgi:SAM-dependent methyltransferase